MDVLRVAMALLIYMFHSNCHFNCHYGILNDIVSVGAIAMTGFFMLSGYSLRLVYGEKNLVEIKELSRFYVKRMLGVLPLYYTLALLYVLVLGNETLGQNLLLLPIEMLGLQSTFCSLFGVTHNGGTWFISCLLLGYLIYPFLQAIVKQLRTKHKIMLLLVLVFIDLWATIVPHKFNTAGIYDNPFYRILEFAIGLVVADVNMIEEGCWMKVLRSRGMLVMSILVFMVGVSVVQHLKDVNDYMLLNWIVLPCFILMLFPLGYIKMPHLEKSKLLNYASCISYAFFLSQYFAWQSGKWFVEIIGYNHNWVRIAFTFTLCVLISILLYEVVQKRLVGLIRKRYNI